MLKRLLGALSLAFLALHGAFGQVDPGEPCGAVTVMEIECDPAVVGSYTLTIDVTNSSGVDAERIRLIAEDSDTDLMPDFDFVPETFVGTVPDTTTTTLATQIVGASGDVICFDVWLLDADFDQCCVLHVCIELPDCDGEQEFIRCDCNRDGAPDIADAIFMLNLLFFGGTPTCYDACDSNDDGGFDIGDPIHCLTTLFAGGPPPPAPFPNCGTDPTADSLDCDSFAACP